jgi:hypothetical protein
MSRTLPPLAGRSDRTGRTGRTDRTDRTSRTGPALRSRHSAVVRRLAGALLAALPVGTVRAADAALPTPAQIAAITFEDATTDNDFVAPFAHDESGLDEVAGRRAAFAAFMQKVDRWPPGQVPRALDRIRNLLALVVLMDIGQGDFEDELPLAIYQRLLRMYPKPELMQDLAFIILHPEVGHFPETAPELDLDVNVGDEQVQSRMVLYAKKMLGRVEGRLPVPGP